MIKSKFKRVTSLFLATLMCVTTFAGIGSTTAYAASGEKADVYMVDFPRDGDANYDGVWGHSNLTLKNGWHTISTSRRKHIELLLWQDRLQRSILITN